MEELEDSFEEECKKQRTSTPANTTVELDFDDDDDEIRNKEENEQNIINVSINSNDTTLPLTPRPDRPTAPRPTAPTSSTTAPATTTAVTAPAAATDDATAGATHTFASTTTSAATATPSATVTTDIVATASSTSEQASIQDSSASYSEDNKSRLSGIVTSQQMLASVAPPHVSPPTHLPPPPPGFVPLGVHHPPVGPPHPPLGAPHPPLGVPHPPGFPVQMYSNNNNNNNINYTPSQMYARPAPTIYPIRASSTHIAVPVSPVYASQYGTYSVPARYPPGMCPTWLLTQSSVLLQNNSKSNNRIPITCAASSSCYADSSVSQPGCSSTTSERTENEPSNTEQSARIVQNVTDDISQVTPSTREPSPIPVLNLGGLIKRKCTARKSCK
jgi:hypothetical protein